MKGTFKLIMLPKTLLSLAIIVSILAALGFYAFATEATHAVNSVTQPAAGYNGAKVSFSFDDGYKSFLTEAAPVLNKYGFAGTAYLSSEYIDGRGGLSWQDAQKLHEIYRWEIGGHTVTHSKMTELDSDELFTEVQENYKTLAEYGLDPQTFATPFGAYDPEVIAEVATKFTGHRTFHDTGYNEWPYNDYLLKVQQVQVGVDVETTKHQIDHAVETGTWVILVFHDIADRPKKGQDSYQYATKDLDAIAKYVHDKNVPVTTVANGLVPKTNSLLSGGSFAEGLPVGWLADTPYVRPDSNRHGALPEPVHSIEMRSLTTHDTQLYSPKVSVKPGYQYVIGSYVNIVSQTGEVGLYVDEYDVTGEWISGKYFTGTIFNDEKSVNIAYVPSSSKVASARVQFIITKDSGTHAYIDEVSWLEAGSASSSNR